MPEMRLRSDGEKKKRSRLRFGSRGGAPFFDFRVVAIGRVDVFTVAGKAGGIDPGDRRVHHALGFRTFRVGRRPGRGSVTDGLRRF